MTDIPHFKLHPTYAIVDPGAVMVEDLNAIVADRAVTAARRSIELASDTPCCRKDVSELIETWQETHHFIRTVIPLISTFR